MISPLPKALLLLFSAGCSAQDFCAQVICCGSDGVTYPTSCDAPPGVRCVSSNRCPSSSPGCPDNEPSLGRRCAVPSSVTCSYGSECCCGQCHPSFKTQCIDGRWSGYYTDACMRPDCPGSGGCSCNGHLHRNRGECGIQADCGRWCYVDDPNNCPDARPSSWGASYSWSCQACRNRGGLPEEPECPVTDGAYINQGRNTADGSSLRSRGETDCARKCYEDLTCEAWTMRKDNNLCWLKTTSEGTTPSRRWVWGLPCGPDGGCEITEGTYINGGRNTKGGRALRSEGRRDCARRCRDDSTCKAWTMRLENNLCWLKTTSEGTTPNKNWVWGLPC